MNKNIAVIEIKKEGFEIQIKKRKVKLNWREVEKIKAYKVDLITIDAICIDFETVNSVITINEDCIEWNKLIDEMQLFFKNINKDWIEDIILPPFERNEISLYSKK